MSRSKTIVLVLLLLFMAIQFIKPARNVNGQATPAAITQQLSVPQNVQYVLDRSCYDCHSNNTRYPWYANVQPITWFLNRHIVKGKAELNFDEFGNYSKRQQRSKLKSIANQVNDGEMPLQSYIWIHRNATLSAADKELITTWIAKASDSLEAKN